MQLREKLLPPPTPSKKAPGPSLQTLHLAIQAAEDVKAKGLSFFNTKAENDMRSLRAEKDMDVTFRHRAREACRGANPGVRYRTRISLRCVCQPRERGRRCL